MVRTGTALSLHAGSGARCSTLILSDAVSKGPHLRIEVSLEVMPRRFGSAADA